MKKTQKNKSKQKDYNKRHNKKKNKTQLFRKQIVSRNLIASVSFVVIHPSIFYTV